MSQSVYLNPDPTTISTLSSLLTSSKMGIVAHYYMDVELQGVLSSLPQHGRLVYISDSLAMGDAAVKMCRDHGAQSIACLGVDFMAESVSAILSKSGFGHVPVYRATASKIGCSLAEAAERDTYYKWLSDGSKNSKNPLHVVYINTSLETKAISTTLMPTIACTSSNVVKTILQAHAQLDGDVTVHFGPDTCMGDNLVELLSTVASTWSDDEIRSKLHPKHGRATVRDLATKMKVYPAGNCVVHHMFGQNVVDTVSKEYGDAYVTAHLEVPGEMFKLAMAASQGGRGVVGSTRDILVFIADEVKKAAKSGQKEPKRLSFILGTEAGMVTSIVAAVKEVLSDPKAAPVSCEIVFPVAADSVTSLGQSGAAVPELKGIVPGTTGGEGCSSAGGCATCPFMKMNDVDALVDVLKYEVRAKTGDLVAKTKLDTHRPPKRLEGKKMNGVDAVELGVESIMYMREMMRAGVLANELVEKIVQKRA